MSYKKGRRLELERKHILENIGYNVEVAPHGTRWSKSKDFYNLFDIIAYNDKHWLLEQVKSGSTRGFIKHIKSTKILTALPPETIVQLAICKKYGKGEDRWRIIKLK